MELCVWWRCMSTNCAPLCWCVEKVCRNVHIRERGEREMETDKARVVSFMHFLFFFKSRHALGLTIHFHRHGHLKVKRMTSNRCAQKTGRCGFCTGFGGLFLKLQSMTSWNDRTLCLIFLYSQEYQSHLCCQLCSSVQHAGWLSCMAKTFRFNFMHKAHGEGFWDSTLCAELFDWILSKELHIIYIVWLIFKKKKLFVVALVCIWTLTKQKSFTAVCAREISIFLLFVCLFLFKCSTDLDDSKYTSVMCWNVGPHTNFVLHDEYSIGKPYLNDYIWKQNCYHWFSFVPQTWCDNRHNWSLQFNIS